MAEAKIDKKDFDKLVEANKSNQETIESNQETIEDLTRENANNTAIIAQLIEKVDGLQTAALAGIGIDPVMAARKNLPTVLVQFTRNYNRAAQPSAVQKGGFTHESYSAAAGDIVLLLKDEHDRLNKDFPDLLETEKEKFKGKTMFDLKPEVNERGQMAMVRVPRLITVKTLTKQAPLLG